MIRAPSEHMYDSFHIALAGIIVCVELVCSIPALVLVSVRMFVPLALSGHELNKISNVHSDPIDKSFTVSVAEPSHSGLG